MIYNTKSTPEIDELITAWQQYIATMGDWQKVIEGVVPKQTDCGPVYEPTNPLDRPNESFAVADMRKVKVAKPHYHANGETEVYFIIFGSGVTIVGGEELRIQAGDVIVTPPETAHFTIPRENLVMIVINTPPFNPENNISINKTKLEVKFDQEQYEKLINSSLSSKQPEAIVDGGLIIIKPQTIVVTTNEQAWAAAQQSGQYTRSTIDSDLASVGFIHATFPGQTIAMLNRHFTDRDDVILLLVDTDKVKSPIKREAALSGRTGTFPHIYGPLNVDAVYDTVKPKKGDDGLFIEPKEWVVQKSDQA